MKRESKGLERAWPIAAGVAVGLLFLSVSVQKIWAGDFWGQLRTGQEILRTLRLPVADDFSFTAAGREVREVRWLYCVLIAIGWKAGAWVLCVGQAVVLGVMWGVILWPARRFMGSPWAWGIAALGVAAGAGRWVLRPELATDLFVVVFLVGLERARRREGIAWWLVGVQVLWVNLHSVYVFGPVLAWMFVGGVAVERVLGRSEVGRRLMWWPASKGCVKRMAVLAGLVTAACWVNPYFHRGATYAVEMWREAGGFVGEAIGEMKSPFSIPIGVWRWDLWCAGVLTAVVAGTYVLNWRRVGPARLGVLVIAVYLGATAQRNLPLLAIMGVWAALANIKEMRETKTARAGGAAEIGRLRFARPLGFVGVVLGSLGLAWYVATDRAWIDIGAPRESGIGVVEWDVPSGAVEFALRSGCRPQVYNHMREGHYIGWRSGGAIKVFVDGRTDVFGDDFLREYMSTGPATWDSMTAKWGINMAIVPVRGYEMLIGFLSKHTAWALVYLDHRNLVFVRDIPEHAGVIAANRVDTAKTYWPRPIKAAEPEEKIDRWKGLIGGKARPWYLFGMAQSFLAVGSLANAEEYLKRTLAKYPGHERSIAELAAIERFTGRVAQGDSRLAVLDARSVWRQYSERTLATYLDGAGRREEAIAAMERAFAAGEMDRPARVVLADWYFGAKKFADARRHYESVIRDGHETAAEWKKLGYVREQAGELGPAAEAYRRSLDFDASQHEVWYLLGLVKGRLGDAAGAREALSRSIRVNPNYAPARRALEGLGG